MLLEEVLPALRKGQKIRVKGDKKIWVLKDNELYRYPEMYHATFLTSDLFRDWEIVPPERKVTKLSQLQVGQEFTGLYSDTKYKVVNDVVINSHSYNVVDLSTRQLRIFHQYADVVIYE